MVSETIRLDYYEIRPFIENQLKVKDEIFQHPKKSNSAPYILQSIIIIPIICVIVEKIKQYETISY